MKGVPKVVHGFEFLILMPPCTCFGFMFSPPFCFPFLFMFVLSCLFRCGSSNPKGVFFTLRPTATVPQVRSPRGCGISDRTGSGRDCSQVKVLSLVVSVILLCLICLIWLGCSCFLGSCFFHVLSNYYQFTREEYRAREELT